MNEIQETVQRLWEHLLARPEGPLALRFLLQPCMAAIFGIRDGIKDARTGSSPYFWTVLTDPVQRAARLKQGLKATSKILLVALALDFFYQFKVLDRFYPLEAIIIAVLLAFVPYLLIRGPVTRIARLRKTTGV